MGTLTPTYLEHPSAPPHTVPVQCHRTRPARVRGANRLGGEGGKKSKNQPFTATQCPSPRKPPKNLLLRGRRGRMPPYAAGLSGRDGDTGRPTRPPPHRLVADDEVFVAKLLSGLSRRFQGPTRRTRADFVFWFGRRGFRLRLDHRGAYRTHSHRRPRIVPAASASCTGGRSFNPGAHTGLIRSGLGVLARAPRDGNVSSRRRRGARMRAAADLGQRNRRRARALIARR